MEEELDRAEDRCDGGGRVRVRGCGQVEGLSLGGQWPHGRLLRAVCHSFPIEAVLLVVVVM